MGNQIKARKSPFNVFHQGLWAQAHDLILFTSVDATMFAIKLEG